MVEEKWRPAGTREASHVGVCLVTNGLGGYGLALAFGLSFFGGRVSMGEGGLAESGGRPAVAPGLRDILEAILRIRLPLRPLQFVPLLMDTRPSDGATCIPNKAWGGVGETGRGVDGDVVRSCTCAPGQPLGSCKCSSSRMGARGCKRTAVCCVYAGPIVSPAPHATSG